ncbi:MAG: hypothetical protein JSR29_07655 [Nitrospira sp.]|nr:hypothetical protein [Nitrospira sp.]
MCIKQVPILVALASCLTAFGVSPAVAQSGRTMSDESLELGKKWVALFQAATGARLAVDDMRTALERMQTDQSEAAFNISQAKKGIAVSAASNLLGLGCDMAGAYGAACKIGREVGKSIQSALECRDGSASGCIGIGLSLEKAVALKWAKQGVYVIDGLTAIQMNAEGKPYEYFVSACDVASAIPKLKSLQGCDAIALVKDMREWQEVRALQANIAVIYNNNLRIGISALQKVEQQARELERQAQEARAAYQAQREKDEEKVRREQEGVVQAKKDYEERGRDKRQQAEMEQPVVQQQGGGESSARGQGHGAELSSSTSGGRAASSEGGSKTPGGKGGGSFDVTAWNYGDPVPGVERPPEFDKPKKKIPCRLKDTDCLDPLYAVDEPSGQQKGPKTQNPWSQEIEQKVKGGLLSHEQIRQDIEQKVRGGRSSGNRSQSPCDENLGCPDDESGDKGPGKNLLAKLDSDLDRIQNSQAGTAGGALPGESLEAGASGSSFDKTAMLRSLRSGLGAYRQGRESFSSSGGPGGGFSGGNCPNRVPVPQELRAIAQRRESSIPLDPTIDEMIAKAGSAEAAISGLRQHIDQLRQALAQWPRGREEETRRQMELEVGYEQQLLQAVEACRSRGKRPAPQVTHPAVTQPGPPIGGGPSVPCRNSGGDGEAGRCR